MGNAGIPKLHKIPSWRALNRAWTNSSTTSLLATCFSFNLKVFFRRYFVCFSFSPHQAAYLDSNLVALRQLKEHLKNETIATPKLAFFIVTNLSQTLQFKMPQQKWIREKFPVPEEGLRQLNVSLDKQTLKYFIKALAPPLQKIISLRIPFSNTLVKQLS